jgi:hypothetical protein
MAPSARQQAATHAFPGSPRNHPQHPPIHRRHADGDASPRMTPTAPLACRDGATEPQTARRRRVFCSSIMAPASADRVRRKHCCFAHGTNSRSSRRPCARSGRGAAATARVELVPPLARREERAGGVLASSVPSGASRSVLLAEVIGAGGFVQLFVHNGCGVFAPPRTCFDPFALRDRTASFGLAYMRLRGSNVAGAAPRMVVCRGDGTSRP